MSEIIAQKIREFIFERMKNMGILPRYEDDVEDIDKPCKECGGTGRIEVMSRVYPNEPHEAYLGETRPCICTVE